MDEWGNYSSPAATRVPPEDLRASEHFRNASRFWIQRVLVPIVVIIGVLGNLVTVVILTRRRMRSSTNMYLTALAASDLLYLVFMFTMSLEQYPNIHHPDYYSYWEYRRFGLWFTDATRSTLTWKTEESDTMLNEGTGKRNARIMNGRKMKYLPQYCGDRKRASVHQGWLDRKDESKEPNISQQKQRHTQSGKPSTHTPKLRASSPPEKSATSYNKQGTPWVFSTSIIPSALAGGFTITLR